MGTYKEVDGLRYTMEQLQNSGEKDQFPTGKGDLVASFKYIEDYMNQNCHPNTTLGAALHGDGLLTDHGVEHVKMVIQNAGKLVGDMQYKRLNGYEIYLLLLAIHFHDVGNVCGRQEHEKKIDDIITALGDRLPLDTPEKVHIMNPVTTHRPMNTLKFSLRLSGYPNAYAIPEDTLTFKTGEALAAHFATQAEVKS